MAGTIEPEQFVPPGRRVVRTFDDAATGYHVIEHVAEGEGRPHVTLVDRRTREIVPIERRTAEIPAGDRVHIDEARGFRLVTRHTIDSETGWETLVEELSEANSGAILARRESSGLRPAGGASDLIAAHLASRERARAEEAFWRDEYPRWSFEMRFAHCDRAIRGHMRRQAEWGLDEYAMFTAETYAVWRERDPEFDRILDRILEGLDSSDRAAIEHRLARGISKTPAPKKSRPRGRTR